MTFAGSTEPTPFGEIWSLILYDDGGGIIGYFYHPNRAAVEFKARELRQDHSMSKWHQVIDRYVLARSEARQ